MLADETKNKKQNAPPTPRPPLPKYQDEKKTTNNRHLVVVMNTSWHNHSTPYIVVPAHTHPASFTPVLRGRMHSEAGGIAKREAKSPHTQREILRSLG